MKIKIKVIEVVTDKGRRAIELSVPLEVTPMGGMPIQFRSLTEALWNAITQVEVHRDTLMASIPKAEA